MNERFFAAASRWAARPALAFHAGSWREWSYLRLARRARGLAAHLHALGVQAGDAVGIVAARHPDTIAAMIAILESGAHYIVLDPLYPRARLRLLCDDAGLKHIVAAVAPPEPQRFPFPIRRLDQLADASASAAPGDRPRNDPGTAAYVMFTSGSTGEPKGVVVPHRAISRLTDNPNFMRLDASRVFLQLAPLGFDASTLEVWGPLLNGGKCVLYPEGQLPTASALKAVIQATGVNSLWLTASLFNSIVDQDARSLAGIEDLLTGGEALSVPHVCRALAELKGIRLTNGYGPTENTTFTTCFAIPADFSPGERRVPIGIPVSGTEILIVDEHLRPVPAGAEGELVAIGEGLALGYLNKPVLTSERFVDIRAADGTATRGYRTGDQVVQTPDGTVHFLGRFDDQVKIEGHRIEPGEIERVIADLSGIKDCRVLAHIGPAGETRLAGYVVAGDPALKHSLRSRLAEILPAFMIPHYFFFLEALPTNANGKLDREALPSPFERRTASAARPTQLEPVAETWREILGREVPSEDLNFFDAGGTSLEAMRLHELLARRFGRELDPTFVFAHTTIRRQAEALGLQQARLEHGPAVARRQAGAAAPAGIALAVVGLAGRFPGARDVGELWENLCAGREGVRFFAADELDPSIPASLRSNPAYVRAKGVLDDFDKFDARFFEVPPLEAQIMDPQQRIMLELAWTALESAGHPPGQFPGRIGVFAGMNWNRYRAYCVAAHPELVARYGDLNTALANEYDFLATRISYKLNLRGPSVTVGSACSTSLVAIAQACRALLNGECDLALAGGVSVSVPVNAGYLYQEGGMLSADGHCRTFDARATGTTFNDGAGLVVLRRLEDATADRDHVYAVVRGFAVNNDGSDRVSFTAPSVRGQADVIRSALQTGGIDPATIGFIETHGTATPLGDPIEVAALKDVFAAARGEAAQCALGSVKSAVGHLVHAAGVTGFIKAVLSVHHGKIPPTLFFESPNPRLGLDDSPFYVNRTLEDWTPSGHPRRAGVSSFGVGGTNAHVIVEEPPRADAGRPAGWPKVLCVSAKDEAALTRQIGALKDFLAARPEGAPLDDVAFTLQLGREPLAHRMAWAVRSVADAVAAVGDSRRALCGRATTGRAAAFMFTGQGAQRARMGQWLYENNAFFRQCFEEGAQFLAAHANLDIRGLMFSDSEPAQAATDETRFAQPALFLLEYSLARTLESLGVKASALLGHSIGELVAATLAGIFSYEDALRVVAKRAEAMQSMPRGSMLAVHLDEQRARSYLSQDVCLAAVNGPELCVLAGTDAAIDRLASQLEARGTRSKRLRTSHAFHSSLMDPAVDLVRAALAGVTLSPPQRLVISTVTGKPLSAQQATDADYWARQLRETVRFAAALDCLADQGEFALLEVGPGGALAALAAQHPRAERWAAAPAAAAAGCSDRAGEELFAAVAHCWVHGAPVDWAQHWDGATPSRVPLPTYPFARTRYWLDPASPQESATVPEQAGAASSAEPAQAEPAATSGAPVAGELEQRVINVLEETSGHELQGADRDLSFAELGFDSLLLTQVSARLKREFGVGVSFRALLEDCASIRRLTEHLAKALPASAPGVEKPKAPAGEEPAPKRHTPGTRIERSAAVAKRLTRAQQAYVERLIDDYAKSTAASKAFAQRHRRRLADPRTVSGFSPLWKETVYPIVTHRSKGSRLWDLDGREYIDLTNGFGPILFGHSPQFVTHAVLRQIAQGIETGPQSPLAGEVAELFCELTGNERVAYANTGSEAVLAALRLARTVTAREKVVMFEGAYHGIIDEVVVRPGRSGAGLPAAPGIPASHTSNMIVLPYGTDASLQRIEELGGELAAVLVEPVQSRRPGLQPVEFLKRLRGITERTGAALIFDEVVTGFRVHPGGAQALFDIRADLALYGKVAAGGYPIGLIGGKARFMDALDGGFWEFGDDSIPEVGVTFFAGTFVRHPIALAATKAVLERIKADGPALQRGLAQRTADMARELKAFLKLVDARVSFEEFSSYFYISIGPEQPYGSLLFTLLRQYGIHAWEFRPCFLTTSHTDEDIAAFKAAFIKAVSQLVQHGLLHGDAVAVERLNKTRLGAPPVEGARLGKDKHGAPAWFIADPERPGKYIQLRTREQPKGGSRNWTARP